MSPELTLKFIDEIEFEDFITLLLESPIKKFVKLTWRGELFETKTLHVELTEPELYIDEGEDD